MEALIDLCERQELQSYMTSEERAQMQLLLDWLARAFEDTTLSTLLQPDPFPSQPDPESPWEDPDTRNWVYLPGTRDRYLNMSRDLLERSKALGAIQDQNAAPESPQKGAKTRKKKSSKGADELHPEALAALDWDFGTFWREFKGGIARHLGIEGGPKEFELIEVARVAKTMRKVRNPNP